jgi:putative transposase
VKFFRSVNEGDSGIRNSLYSDSHILSILKRAQGVRPVLEPCREHGMGGAAFYLWRSKYGGGVTSA